MLNIYEVPLGMCGEPLCPEPDVDCWTCTLHCIKENGLEMTCGCDNELCAVCGLKMLDRKEKIM